MKPRTTFLIALLFALLAWGMYASTARFGFVYYDDVRILRDHPELYAQESFRESLRAVFVTCFPREEPLLVRDLSWVVDSMLFGFGNPLGYHVGNIVLHGLVVALLFIFLVSNTSRATTALWTTALFLVLGVHVEPVAWIMGRKDLLSALFMVLALCAQTWRLSATSRCAAGAWYGLTLLCLVAGLLSKISVLSFPAVLLLHAWLSPYLRGECDPGHSLPWRRLLTREVPLSVPMFCASIGVFVWYRAILNETGLLDRGYSDTGIQHLWNLAMINPMVCWLYLKQICLPAHLSVLYTWPFLPDAFRLPDVLAALATLVAGVAITFKMMVYRKDLLFYWAAFFALMVPYMNFIYVGIWAADRYLYFASFCLLAIAVQVGFEIAGRGKKSRAVIIAVAAVMLGANLWQTVSYPRAWRNGESLWQYHIELPHPSSVAYNNLAATYYTMVHEAIEADEKTHLLRKMDVVVNAGLQTYWPDRASPPPRATWHLFFLKSILDEIRGMPETAIESLLISERLNGGFRATRLNLAKLYCKLSLGSEEPTLRRDYALKAVESLGKHLRREPTPEMITAMLGAECLAAAQSP
ncbi:MAG: hypothetical protein O3C57_04450 [Verrucomicrobia bacterium]|nr:hypothetical protein [Verrucomicrobiota bacterium]